MSARTAKMRLKEALPLLLLLVVGALTSAVYSYDLLPGGRPEARRGPALLYREGPADGQNTAASALVSPPVSSPVILGWGGTEVKEASTFETVNPASRVFAGQQASNQELQVDKLVTMGFNAFRVSFESQCTTWKDAGPYSSANLERSFRIAEHYNFWIIVDYHGYNDTSTSATVDCWLEFWSGLVQQFKTRYYRTIWEPINEPTGLGFTIAAVPSLSVVYQRWVDQTRNLGDMNWIVVQNLCSFRCDFDRKEDGYPNVADPLRMILISLHPYMSYKQYWTTWDNQTAESKAYSFYNAMTYGTLYTGWPILNTEGGPGGTFNGTQRCTDIVEPGSAGYCRTNFHFMQALTNLLDSNPETRINWIWWTMSGGTDTAAAGTYGALNTWGGLLHYRVVFPADINNDCRVNIFDLAKVATSYGARFGDDRYSAVLDINNDGLINISDVAFVASYYWKTCSYRS